MKKSINLSARLQSSKLSKSLSTRGFTLIEMMVVVAIIAILTGIIMTNFTGAKARARDAKRISDLGNIQLALELAFDRCNNYPKVFNVTPNLVCNKNSHDYLMSDFIGTIPQPTPEAGQSNYDYVTNDPTTPTDYILHATLEASSTNSQQNSLKQSDLTDDQILMLKNGGSVQMFNCWDGTNSPREYCLGPK